MKKTICILALVLMSVTTFAQTVTLTFTGRNAANHYMQLDRVVITNQTKGWQETIYWPDTTLIMQNVTGIDDASETRYTTSLQFTQNNPNPFTGTTDVNLTVADAGAVTLEIVDGNGRIIVGANNYSPLPTGTHQFRVSLSAAGTYVMTARQNGKTSSIKMVCNGAGNGNGIEYTGTVGANDYSPLPKSHTRGTTTNPFTFGDQMEYVGYATLNGEEVESQHITQIQSAPQTFVLLFSETPIVDGQPCPGTPTLTDIDGNIYNTVWIGTQCWMKESLRTTKYPDGTILDSFPTNTDNAYWMYAENNGSPWTKPIVGLLYSWAAVMNEAESSNSSPSGVQGICPDGWHVPSSAEWNHLTDYVSSQSQYICGDDNTNIGKALADTAWWSSSTTPCSVGFEPNSNNATGFSARPAGYFASWTTFGIYSCFWSSTEINSDCAVEILLQSNWPGVYVQDIAPNGPKNYAFSVRCVRD
jgi:uncharacterized protein (TIGR02145 family)